MAVGLAVAVALAFVVAPHASSDPDGLEKVAADHGIDASADQHALVDAPLADYSVAGLDDSGLGTGIAGAVGIAATFLVGFGVFAVLRKRRPPATCRHE